MEARRFGAVNRRSHVTQMRQGFSPARAPLSLREHLEKGKERRDLVRHLSASLVISPPSVVWMVSARNEPPQIYIELVVIISPTTTQVL